MAIGGTLNRLWAQTVNSPCVSVWSSSRLQSLLSLGVYRSNLLNGEGIERAPGKSSGDFCECCESTIFEYLISA